MGRPAGQGTRRAIRGRTGLTPVGLRFRGGGAGAPTLGSINEFINSARRGGTRLSSGDVQFLRNLAR